MLRIALFLVLFVTTLDAASQCVRLSDWTRVVPSAGVPDDLDLRKANNNLDVVRLDGRFYLAVRNSRTHFASKHTRLIVLSSDDLVDWSTETVVDLDSDIREPRFIAWNDSLYLYFFQAGTKMLRFQPRFMQFVVRGPDGAWSRPVDAGLDGYVPWRIKPHQGRLLLSAYYGGSTYKNDGEVVSHMRLFHSDDARTWTPLSDAPQLTHPRSVSEFAFTFDRQGHLWGVARLELDGSYTVFAHRDSLHVFQPVYSEFKYDSPIMFRHADAIYLIARRNLHRDGRFARFGDRPRRNLVRYSLTRKTTALWRLDPNARDWVHVMDLGGTGDTAFPGVVDLGGGRFVVMNYSSDLDGRRKAWLAGQLGPTHIYHALLDVDAACAD